MFTPCCVRLVFVLCVTGSGLLADCVCTYVFVAVLEFVFAFCFLFFVRCCRDCAQVSGVVAPAENPRDTATSLGFLDSGANSPGSVWLKGNFPRWGGGKHKHLRRALGAKG